MSKKINLKNDNEKFEDISVKVAIVLAFIGIIFFCDSHRLQKGIVREKKNNSVYVSPLKDTLASKRLRFIIPNNSTYELAQIGDTIEFYNSFNLNTIPAPIVLKVNGDDIHDALREFKRAEKLSSQIHSNAHVK